MHGQRIRKRDGKVDVRTVFGAVLDPESQRYRRCSGREQDDFPVGCVAHGHFFGRFQSPVFIFIPFVIILERRNRFVGGRILNGSQILGGGIAQRVGILGLREEEGTIGVGIRGVLEIGVKRTYRRRRFHGLEVYPISGTGKSFGKGFVIRNVIAVVITKG